MNKNVDADFLALPLTAVSDAAISTAKDAGASHVDVRIDPTVDPNRAAPAKPKKAAATEAGEASPDDETTPTRSSIDIITSSLGGQVISESPRDA